MKKKSEPRN